MKKVSLIIFYVMIFVLATCSVNAQCTNEEINNLKKEANKIKVTYKHLGAVENDEQGIEYNHFNVTFKNLNNDFYVENGIDIKWDNNENGIISFDWISGKTIFYVYSKKCNILIKEIDAFIPYFNEYSMDSLCEGIDTEKFSLCSKYKYTTYSVDYETFRKKIEEYRKKDSSNSISNEDDEEKTKYKEIINFIKQSKVYFFIGTAIMIVFLISQLFISKRRMRGVLK